MKNYFSGTEILLWIISMSIITGSFIIFDRTNFLALTASLIGSTAIIINAKGNPFGQFMMIIFSIIYGIISYRFSYYGEMITYMAMSGPMAVFSFISWIRNPYEESKSEVKVNKIEQKEIIFMLILSAFVTVIFYFILKHFGTANLIPSTFSITTSFIAVYLTFRRSAFFSLAYAVNDVILILLWTLATVSDVSYISVLICFIVFLANDIYAFTSWKKMEIRQNKKDS